MKVHAVIVTYNGAQWIGRALQSLQDSAHPCLAIVVDNASTDDTLALVRRDFPATHLIESGANLGFGRGNNLGIERALRLGADAILLLNQDAYVTQDAVGELAAFLQTHPDYDIVSPLHCSPDLEHVDPNTQTAYLQRYAPAYLSDACLGRVQAFYPLRGVNAAAWMLRSGVFRNVGGFDPLFFMYGEDDDLIERFAYHGVRTALLPAARIVHLRARAVQPPQGWWHRMLGRSRRRRALLLTALKTPGSSLTGQLTRLLSDGVLRPAADLLDRHDLQGLTASLLASGRLLGELPRIRAHARRCASRGPHFLDLDKS